MSSAHYREPALIDAYGDGGFRFAGYRHEGALLALPSGIHAWPVKAFSMLAPEDFGLVFQEAREIEFLLLGCGPALVVPSPEIRSAFAEHGIGLEPMDTGAACRTWNVLLAEGRAVAAALIAVE